MARKIEATAKHHQLISPYRSVICGLARHFRDNALLFEDQEVAAALQDILARTTSVFLRELGEMTAAERTLPPTPEEAATHQELSGRIDLALRRLTPKQRQLVRMRFGLGEGEHTVSEIAVMLGITEDSVRARVHNAIMQLRSPRCSWLLRSFIKD